MTAEELQEIPSDIEKLSAGLEDLLECLDGLLSDEDASAAVRARCLGWFAEDLESDVSYLRELASAFRGVAGAEEFVSGLASAADGIEQAAALLFASASGAN